MNVIGSRPTGWWRDRDGAIRRLIEELRAFASRSPEPVIVVFDRLPPDAPAEAVDRLEVAVATRRGPNAADDEVVRRVRVDPDPSSLRVVTSDRDLADRVSSLGAEVVSAGSFRRRLDEIVKG